MKIVFVSNILNHHQTCLCEALQKRCSQFYFVATQNVITFGYQKSVERPYVLHYYDATEKERSIYEIMQADVVIFGNCANELIEMRMRENKLSFLFRDGRDGRDKREKKRRCGQRMVRSAQFFLILVEEIFCDPLSCQSGADMRKPRMGSVSLSEICF